MSPTSSSDSMPVMRRISELYRAMVLCGGIGNDLDRRRSWICRSIGLGLILPRFDVVGVTGLEVSIES